MTKKLLRISKYKPSIFQGTLDFASKQHVSLVVEHPNERYLTYGLVLVLLALVGGYLYLVTATVLNVMARREALAQISKIEGVIGSVEQNYLALSHDITPLSGLSLGLHPVGPTEYVRRPGSLSAGVPAQADAGAATIARDEI